MKPRPSAILLPLASALGLFALAGCNILPPLQADATHYYVLAGPALTEPGTLPGAGALRLGLKAVEVEPYLRKGSLVVRTGDNEVTFLDQARWAEPVEQEIVAALRQRLLAAPGVGRVFVTPFPFEQARDFDVSVQVLHCEGLREGGRRASAQFAATIEVTTAGTNAQVVARKSFVAPDAAWDGKDPDRLAELLGQAVGALSQEVVAALPEKK